MSLCLNLGSGQRPFAKPWINVDIQERWHPDVTADGAHMPMFEDASADMIVLHHVYEHAGLGDNDAMIRECHRILAPNGSLLVFVPDMRELAKAWLRGQIDDYIYMVNVYGAYQGDEADRHKFGYWGPSLAKALDAAVRWSHIKTFDWRKIEGADIAGPEFWILALEALK